MCKHEKQLDAKQNIKYKTLTLIDADGFYLKLCQRGGNSCMCIAEPNVEIWPLNCLFYSFLAFLGGGWWERITIISCGS